MGTIIQTAFMERWYGTLRGWVAALRRRTRCLSWSEKRHQGRVWLIVSLYNWVIPHKSLRQGRVPRTPAMVIGLTDHVWSYTEYIWHPVHQDPEGKRLRDQRIEALLTPALTNEKEAKANAPPKKTKEKRKPSRKKAA